MKKVYTTPHIKVMTMQTDCLLAASGGSVNATDENGNKLDGITGGTPTETGSTPVEADAKKFSVWDEE